MYLFQLLGTLNPAYELMIQYVLENQMLITPLVTHTIFFYQNIKYIFCYLRSEFINSPVSCDIAATCEQNRFLLNVSIRAAVVQYAPCVPIVAKAGRFHLRAIFPIPYHTPWVPP